MEKEEKQKRQIKRIVKRLSFAQTTKHATTKTPNLKLVSVVIRTKIHLGQVTFGITSDFIPPLPPAPHLLGNSACSRSCP